VTHLYFGSVYMFLASGSRISILEGPYAGHKGWVECVAFQQPTGSDERCHYYQAKLESGKWINVRTSGVAPGWLNDDDMAWMIEMLPRLTFPED
jgi:hypothetical protein